MGRGLLCLERSAKREVCVSRAPRVSRDLASRLAPGWVLLATLLFAAQAQAAPITFFFTAGSADVTATTSVSGTVVVDTTIDLDGVFVTFDDAIPEVVDFSITAPQSSSITMTNPYGGFDTFVIESAIITPGTGFTNISVTSGGPDIWNFLIAPVDIAGEYSASHTSGIPPAVMNLPVPFTDPSALSGTINTDAMTFELLGITLAELDGSNFGETEDLIIKADITWSGVVPEPGTATLLGCGLAGLAARRRAIAGRRRSV